MPKMMSERGIIGRAIRQVMGEGERAVVGICGREEHPCTVVRPLKLLERQAHQIALTHPRRPPTPSTPRYRLLPSDQTISRTSVPTPSGTGGTPLPLTSSLRKLRTSTQSFMASSTSGAVLGSGGGIDEKATAGEEDWKGFEPERTRRGVELPDCGFWKMGQ